jgi:hypothetical protein
MPQDLRAQLEAAKAELKAHMASWEYAYAMGASPNDHPRHEATRRRTEQLRRRCRELEARLAEHEL